MRDVLAALCCQTVTLYHHDPANGSVARTVLHGCFLDKRRRATLGSAGSSEVGAFLLVIPQAAGAYGADYTLCPQDRVFEGEGPAVDAAGWAAFVPLCVPGLCTVQYVDPKTRRNRPCHVEAGGWWTKGGSGAHSLTN